MTMIEKIARTIEDGLPAYTDNPYTKADYLSAARAAVEAMRSATNAMYDNWRSVNCTKGTGGLEEFTGFSGDFGNWLACHTAMIDAILNEKDD